MRTVTVLAALAALSLPLHAARAADEPAPAKPGAKADDAAVPPIFANEKLEALIEKNKGTRNILVAKATAVWCAPCKLMDRTTWRDATVVEWFKKHEATAVQFDVDKDKDTAATFAIRAMPTMIAFRNGEVIDRIMGYRSPEQLLTWLERLRTGGALGEATIKPDPSARPTVRDRMQKARDLAADHPDKAADEYAKLWGEIPQDAPAFVGVRNTFLAADIRDLASTHAPTAARFAKIRDEAALRYKSQPRDQAALTDWLVLNGALGDDKSTLDWFDSMKAAEQNAPLFTRLEYILGDVLARAERYDDLGKIIPDAPAKLSQDLALRDTIRKTGEGRDKPVQEAITASADTDFRARVGRLYGAMLAANRPEDAAKVRASALEADTSPDMKLALVDHAVRAGRPTTEMIELLDQAAAAGKTAEAAKLREEILKRLR
jgi:thioredoxin 1